LVAAIVEARRERSTCAGRRRSRAVAGAVVGRGDPRAPPPNEAGSRPVGLAMRRKRLRRPAAPFSTGDAAAHVLRELRQAVPRPQLVALPRARTTCAASRLVQNQLETDLAKRRRSPARREARTPLVDAARAAGEPTKERAYAMYQQRERP